MADIFISYSQADRDWVEKLARLIEKEGFSVWWDIKVLPGDEFGDMVVREIATSKCVVVVWSKHSVQSDWVYGEADEARKTKKLVPVIKDEVHLPTAFRKIHAADFSQWEPDANSPQFAILLNAIRGRVQHALGNDGASPMPAPPQYPSTNYPRGNATYAPAAPPPGSLEAAIAGAFAWASQPSKVTLRAIFIPTLALSAVADINFLSAPNWTIWNLYWVLSVWATLVLFGILAFSKETALPTIVRLFLIVAALDNTIGPLQLLVVVDEPKPWQGLFLLGELAKCGLFGAMALNFSPALAARLRPFALAAIGYLAVLNMANSSLSNGESEIVSLFTALLFEAMEAFVVCMAPVQFAQKR